VSEADVKMARTSNIERTCSYTTPPALDITLEEFETFAIARLKGILGSIELAFELISLPSSPDRHPLPARTITTCSAISRTDIDADQVASALVQ
jgi:hypothetical protein